MSSLSAFLKPLYKQKTVKIKLSDRFVDENGNPAEIVMRTLTQDELNAIARRSTHEKKIGNKTVQEVDANEHLNRCLIASIVEPDMTSKELCNAYGTEDPVMLPTKMFLVGEYETLAKTFAKLNGLKKDDGSLHIAGEVTKN